MKLNLKLPLAVVSYFLLITGAFAQKPADPPPDIFQLISEPGADLYDIQSLLEAYQINNQLTTEQLESDDELLSKWSRFNHFWSSNVAPGSDGDGDPFIYLEALMQYAQTGLEDLCDQTNNSNWSQIGPTEFPVQKMGMVTALARDENNHAVAYAGTASGGVWKTTNLTSTTPNWVNITDDLNLPTLAISDLLIDPNNSNVIYATTASNRGGYSVGVLKSSDAGASWSLIIENQFLNDGAMPYRRVLVDPANSNFVYVLTPKHFRFSNDGGSTWTNFQPPAFGLQNLTDFEFHPVYPNTLIVAGKEKVWMAQPSMSNTWTILNLTNTVETDNYPRIDVAGGNIYVLYTDQNGDNQIDKSSNNGSSFTNLASPNHYGVQFEVSSANDQFMYIGDVSNGRSVAKSVDGGDHFELVSEYSGLYLGVFTHADIREMILLSSSGSSASDELLVGTDGGILYSNSSYHGSTANEVYWVDKTGRGLAITEFFGIDILGHYGYIAGGAQDNAAFLYRNGNYLNYAGGDCYDTEFITTSQGYEAWVQQISVTGKHMNLVKYQYPQNGNAIIDDLGPPYCNSCGQSFPAGNWWKYSKTPLVEHNGVLYAGRKDVFKLVNGSWVAISDFHSMGVTGADLLKVLAIAPSNPNRMIAAFGRMGGGPQSKIVFKTNNGGQTWTDITTSLDPQLGDHKPVEDIIFDPEDDDRVWISFGGTFYDPNYPTDITKSKDRVAYSSNFGNSWTSMSTNSDISKGLPPFPVNKLVYQKGSNDCIYAATGVGVFYKTASMSEWECYQNNFPVSNVSDLEINYCSGKLIAGTFGRGLWESPLAVPVNQAQKNFSTTQTLTSNEVINADVVYIHPGVTLTLENCTWFMSQGAQITIAPSAKLILDGATITNQCEGLWAGIEVRGDNSKTQFPNGSGTYDQGILITKNNAVIENAEIAVRVFKGGANGYNGGIVQAVETTFRNNSLSVEFKEYENHFPSSFGSVAGMVTNNRSYFHDCTFLQNAELNGGGYPQYLVKLWGIRGLPFKGCTFQQTTNVTASITGIYSINAQFEVGERCTGLSSYPCSGSNLDRSQFINLRKGVVATGALDNRSFEVHDCNFINCNNGITFDAVDDAFIVKNKFTFNRNITGQVLCIYGYQSTRYKIEENEILLANRPLYYPIGILIKDGGKDYNELYKNTVNWCYYGLYGHSDNFSPVEGSDGLKFICNSVRSTNRDLISWQGNGISQMQGEYDPQQFQFIAADNTFKPGLDQNLNEFHVTQDNNLNPILYYHRNNTGGLVYKPTELSNTMVFQASQERTCESNYGDEGELEHVKHTLSLPTWSPGTGSDIDDFKIIFDEEYSSYEEARDTYEQTIDKGDTPGLLQSIDNLAPGDAPGLLSLLLNSSPISDQGLIAGIERQDLDENQMTQVLDVNPYLGRNAEIIQKLEESPQGYSQQMIDDFVLASQQPGAVDEMLGTMAHHTARWSFAANQIIDYYCTDTIIYTDSILLWLGKVPRYGYFLSKALANQSFGNTTDARNLLLNAGTTIAMSSEDNYQNNQILDLLDDYTAQFSGTEPWNFSSSFNSKLDDVGSIYDTKAGAYARNLKRFANSEPYDIVVDLLPNPSPRFQYEPPVEEEVKFSVYPNPANHYTRFVWSGVDLSERTSLKLFSVDGRLVYEGQIDQSDDEFTFYTGLFVSGVYFYSLESNEKVYTSGKLVIKN